MVQKEVQEGKRGPGQQLRGPIRCPQTIKMTKVSKEKDIHPTDKIVKKKYRSNTNTNLRNFANGKTNWYMTSTSYSRRGVPIMESRAGQGEGVSGSSANPKIAMGRDPNE